jgi:hypothetical protein
MKLNMRHYFGVATPVFLFVKECFGVYGEPKAQNRVGGPAD